MEFCGHTEGEGSLAQQVAQQGGGRRASENNETHLPADARRLKVGVVLLDPIVNLRQRHFLGLSFRAGGGGRHGALL